RLEVAHRLPGRGEDHALHADRARRAHYRDARGQRVGLLELIGHQRDHPARMHAPGRLQRLAGPLVLGGVEVDRHQVQRADALLRLPAPLARLLQELRDLLQIESLVEAEDQLVPGPHARLSGGDRLARVMLAHSLLQARPSCARSSSAAGGPQLPAGYGNGAGNSALSVTLRMLPTIRHAASTSSLRVKSVWAPRIASSRRRSYASGRAEPNGLP